MKNPGSRGLWEGHTPPITGQPDANQGQGHVITSATSKPQPVIRCHGSSMFSYTTTVQLGIDEIEYPEGVDDRRGHVLGRLTWGQGAGRFSAEIDWKVGTVVTVVATSLELAAFFDPEDREGDESLIVKATVNAALVWGSRPGELAVTRTYRRVLDDGETAIIPIPNFATALTLSSSNPTVIDGTTPGLSVRFLGGPTAADRNYLTATGGSGIFQQALTTGGIILPAGARFLEIVNGTGIDALDINAIWNLAL